uniref:Uncharacterized protein n=1 Tax=Panagrolaimus sp. ES5 TaxID=591445 RepID=A0AC34FB38_9BILA
MLSSTANLQLQPGLKFLNSDEFRASTLPQVFSLPESIIFYMAKNPPSSGVHQKMIQSCKYFFAQNPILHLHCLCFDDKNGWKTCVENSCLGSMKNRKYREISLDMDKIQSKIWIEFALEIFSSNPSFTSSFIKKLYNGNITYFELMGQNISFNELLFFFQNVICFALYKSTVFYENGGEVPCEIILASLPKLKKLIFRHPPTFHNDSKTVAELLKIPHLKNLVGFVLDKLSESFDIETFFEYLKKNNKTCVVLIFNNPLSEEYKQKLQAIIDKILDAELPRSYKPPYIDFEGQLRGDELYELCKKYFKSLS